MIEPFGAGSGGDLVGRVVLALAPDIPTFAEMGLPASPSRR
jgi:hypothetical protein